MMGSLYSYKMTHDDGFAPNPFQGLLTLATCKPGIRQTKNVGDWIAGWTAYRLFRAGPGGERLVYLMRVSEKITLAEYFSNSRFNAKIPKLSSKNIEDQRGDNIYEFSGGEIDDRNNWIQHENSNHHEGHITDDLKSKYVLVGEEFYYFGCKPLEVQGSFRPDVPKSQTRYGDRNDDQEQTAAFIEYVKAEHAKLASMPRPHGWHREEDDDESCNSTCSPSKPKVRKARGCKPTC